MAIVTYPLNGIDFSAEDAETYLCTRTSGVFSSDGNFKASVTGDRQVTISPGLAWIKNAEFSGKSICNTEPVPVEIPIADGTRPRIDRIVLRFDKARNESSIVLKQGTPSSAPTAKDVERTELVYELGLCTVYIKASSTIINNGDVTSTLLDESVCGLMRDGVTGIPTSQLQEQVYDLINDLREVIAGVESGTQMMLKAVYDPDLNVKESGGIKAYTAAQLQPVQTSLSNLLYPNAGAHNAVYRGKFLGNTVTAAQYAAIKAGTFDDLYIGDYWTIGDVKYRIAAFDYYLNSGDTACTTHHAVIVPDTCLYNAAMNSTNTTAGGYVGSAMYKSHLEQAKTTIKNAFSGHVLKHRIRLTNAVSNGHASGSAWCDSEVDLMCEHMVYGSGIFSPVSYNSDNPDNHLVEKSQLPLFQHDPSKICNGDNWWLRDVITERNFADVYESGIADNSGAINIYGVRPFFCIY